MIIAGRKIQPGRTFIIAEIGGNHEGDFQRAKEMVSLAASAGVDAVKFQILKADSIVNSSSPKPAYSGISHQGQWERFKKIEFALNQYRELKKLCDQLGIVFLASVFDRDSVDLVNSLLPAYKIASGDLTYYSLLKHIKSKRKPIILSTGASNLKEIQSVVRLLGKKNLAVLHCVCAYPAPHDQLNLKAIPFLAKKLNIPIGYSDHSVGIEAVIAAVALGACIIEKHFTMDKLNPVGDHKLSVNPDELKQMVKAIRNIDKALGREARPVFSCEQKGRDLARRSLYAAKDVRAGEKMTSKNVIALRPLNGITADYELRILGKKTKKPLGKGEPLTASHV